MKKETTIDLTKFWEANRTFESEQSTKEQKAEAQRTISCIRDQSIGVLLDEFEANPVFECHECAGGPIDCDCYYSNITFGGIPAILWFSVSVTPDLSVSLRDISLHCFALELYNFSINPRKSLQFQLNVSDKDQSMLLQYEAPGN